MLLSGLGMTEYYRMALPSRRLEGYVAAFLGVFIPLAAVWQTPAAMIASIVVPALLLSLLVLFRFTDINVAATEAAFLLFGLLYVPVLLSHLVLLRGTLHGTSWIFLLLVIVMSGDTGAFYVGSAIGKRKLYPSVSPKKSVEGAIGGLVGSIAGAFIAKATFFPELTAIDCIATAAILGILGPLGDLFESLLKRSFGVKDSGNIVYGHGGILDRLDSVLFAAPAAYYYVWLMH